MPTQKSPARKAERPILWIVAGPNGSGKSTLYDQTDIEDFGKSVWIINPDLLTARIRQVEKLRLNEANLAAVQRIEKWLEASIEAHRTVGVETVLSTPKYRRLVRKAQDRQFEIRLIYILLSSPDLNVERVKLRVKKKGHHVPHAPPEDSRAIRPLAPAASLVSTPGRQGLRLRQLRCRAGQNCREERLDHCRGT